MTARTLRLLRSPQEGKLKVLCLYEFRDNRLSLYRWWDGGIMVEVETLDEVRRAFRRRMLDSGILQYRMVGYLPEKR